MMTASRATKAACLAAARRRWGKRAFVREFKGAMTPAEREAHIAKQKTLKADLDELDKRAKELGASYWAKLLEAAEFFLAVNGDEPSGMQFRNAVVFARDCQDLNDLRKATREQWEAGRGYGSKKWSAGYYGTIDGIGDYSSSHAHGDTLDELLERIESNS